MCKPIQLYINFKPDSFQVIPFSCSNFTHNPNLLKKNYLKNLLSSSRICIHINVICQPNILVRKPVQAVPIIMLPTRYHQVLFACLSAMPTQPVSIHLYRPIIAQAVYTEFVLRLPKEALWYLCCNTFPTQISTFHTAIQHFFWKFLYKTYYIQRKPIYIWCRYILNNVSVISP